MTSRLHVVGVRHHSPACARLVQATIEDVRPAHVLIEGPADFNARIDELALGHAPPIAIFTHYQDGQRHHASWTPFCSYSPEWVALEAGRRVGAQVRFCDLPAWHAAFEGRSNRYGDLAGARERARSQRLMAALAARTHSDDLDVLWEHLFEQAMPAPTLAAALRAYFIELRGDAPGGDRDGPREAFMARWATWALGSATGDVVVVCGGWHAPAIEGLVSVGPPEPSEPVVEAPPATARHGSELVPYAYRRLDAFAGYDAGMPSPLYQEWVWRHGQTLAAERAMRAVTERVRRRDQPLSTADLIAAHTMAHGLAALRGHAEPLRSDVLDGLAGAMVKDGLEVAMPWARRGPLSPRTHPLLVEVVAALSGDRVGRLAASTPRPALFADIARELAALGLAPDTRPSTISVGSLEARPSLIKVSLRTPDGRAKSRVLHRLRVLQIPGFTRTAGPTRATDVALDETWSVRLAPDANDGTPGLRLSAEQEAAIIEAAQWGPSLEAAAVARLEAALGAALGRLSALAAILVEAVFVGALGPAGLDSRIIAQVARAVGSEPSFAELGAATTSLLDLLLHGELLGAAGAHQLEAIIVAAFDRGLWLQEGIVGEDAPVDEAAVQACVALRDVHAFGPPAIARDHAEAVWSRRAVDGQCPASLRGACLGALWSLDRLGDLEAACTHAVEAVRGAALPTRIGDLLTGLFATARAQVLSAPALLGVIDDVLSGLGDHEIMVALPSLRMAFAYFPPNEREHIARHILSLHGADERTARAMVRRLELDPAAVASGVALDAAVAAIARRYGLETP